jgi:hypothetical protein
MLDKMTRNFNEKTLMGALEGFELIVGSYRVSGSLATLMDIWTPGVTNSQETSTPETLS